MPAQARLGDKSKVDTDSHGCMSCAHTCVGPAVSGSPNVFVNGKAAVRIGDTGVHSACCGPNTWKAIEGAPHVFINGRAAHRLDDKDQHCGGVGKMIEGSPNVVVGNGTQGSPTHVLGALFAARYRIVDAEDGSPIARVKYSIWVDGARRTEGATDDEGWTAVVRSDESKTSRLTIPKE